MKKKDGSIDSPLITWCDRIINLGFYLLFALIPFLLTPLNYELFEFNKMVGVYIITTLIVTSWIVKMIQQKEIRIAKTPLDIPIALFVTSQLVSTLFSIDPHVSWFGYYSRFNGGMWSVICYVALYYAYVTNWSNKSNWTNLLKTTLLSAALVAIYGVLERLGIDKNLWVQDVQNRVFSTLGQPNWLAAYLVALAPLSMALALQQVTIDKVTIDVKKYKMNHVLVYIVYSLITLLLFTTLLFTKSRSGLLGFVVADAIFIWAVLTTFARSHLAKPVLIIHIFFALIIFFIGTGSPAIDKYVTVKGWSDLTNKLTVNKVTQETKPEEIKPTGPALEVGGTESGTIRKYVWQGAINAWKSTTKTFLIGTGTETFAFAFYQFRPVGHNMTSEWDFLYNKAHNEYLNYLATTGIFGLGSYLLFIGTFIWWFIKSQYTIHNHQNLDIENCLPAGEAGILETALFSGWISILVTNFFGFSVVIIQLYLFLFPALVIASYKKDTNDRTLPLTESLQWMTWSVIALGVVLLYLLSTYWYADTLFASGYHSNRSGLYAKAAPLLIAATSTLPNEPSYHDELAQSYAALSAGAFDQKNATQASQLASLAIAESDKAVRQSPQNVNFLKTRTKIFYTLSSLNPEYNNDAVLSLRRARVLSPNDPKIYYNLAVLLGRQQEADEAISLLIKAKELKANYRDAYYALHVFYLEEKKPTEAKAILTEYLTTIDPTDKDFIQRVK